MMRIGLILRGGVDQGTEEHNPFPVFVDFIRHLATDNDVQVFSLHGENRVRMRDIASSKPSTYRFAGAEVCQLGTSRISRLRISTDVVRVLAAIILGRPKAERPQILHGIGHSAGFVATAVGKLAHIPSVVSLVGGELTSVPDAGYGDRRTVRGRVLNVLLLSWASAVTAASVFMQRRIGSHGRHAQVLPFGIDVRRFHSPIERPPGPPFRLLHVGNLYPIKDQLSLIRATRLLVDAGVDVTLDIVGWDDWHGTVQRE